MAGGQGRSRYVTLRDIVGQRMRKLAREAINLAPPARAARS